MTLFTPKTAGTQNIAATSSSANIQLTNISGCSQVKIKNADATNMAFIDIGSTSALTTSATTGMPVGPGESVYVSIPNYGTVFVAAVSAVTSTVYFTPGNANYGG